ncbi:hypothetical protein EVAR_28349_1 [Eumeta japonica]|uniref:Uncharacterized protein n=1 Tax=Eumeta variegata TaxID=151549 RepID=A0A4C1V9D8_EUMVA|nr:hypothetical protein EVAR_28349_1 [Eumeta japonica]
MVAYVNKSHTVVDLVTAPKCRPVNYHILAEFTREVIASAVVYRSFALFALFAVAFANPKPEPQTFVAPASVPVVGYSAYSPVGYAAPYSAVPYGYSAYGAYYVR